MAQTDKTAEIVYYCIATKADYFTTTLYIFIIYRPVVKILALFTKPQLSITFTPL